MYGLKTILLTETVYMHRYNDCQVATGYVWKRHIVRIAASLRVFNRCYYIRCFYFIIICVFRHRCKSNFNRKKGQQIQLNIRLNYEGVNKILVDRHYF